MDQWHWSDVSIGYPFHIGEVDQEAYTKVMSSSIFFKGEEGVDDHDHLHQCNSIALFSNLAKTLGFMACVWLLLEQKVSRATTTFQAATCQSVDEWKTDPCASAKGETHTTLR